MSHINKPLIDLRKILEISTVVGSISGLLLNAFMLFLILKKAGSKLKSYQKILLQNCVFDIIFNLVTGITRAQTDLKNGNFYVIITSAYGPLSYFLTNLFVTSFITCIFLCVTSLTVQFIHRYFLIIKNINFTTKRYTSVITVATIIPFSYAFAFFYFMQPTQEIIDETSKLLYSDQFYYVHDLNFVVGNITNWRMIILIVCVAIMINGSYGIVLWTNYKVWKHLQLMESHMSVQTKNIHQQMTKAMIAQAIIPFLFCLLPIFISVISVILFVNIDGFGLPLSFIVSWFPFANSLTTIFVVKQYRNFVIVMYRRIFCMNITNTTPVIPSSQLVTNAKHILNNNANF